MSERLFSNVYLVVYIDITALSLFFSTKKGTLENYFTVTVRIAKKKDSDYKTCYNRNIFKRRGDGD